MPKEINIAKLPYYAVIFTSKKAKNTEGYDEISQKMVQSVKNQEGFLGFESAREDIGITVSCWKDLKSIERWKNDIEHQKAQKLGKELWYEWYRIRIAKVEKEYEYKTDSI